MSYQICLYYPCITLWNSYYLRYTPSRKCFSICTYIYIIILEAASKGRHRTVPNISKTAYLAKIIAVVWVRYSITRRGTAAYRNSCGVNVSLKSIKLSDGSRIAMNCMRVQRYGALETYIADNFNWRWPTSHFADKIGFVCMYVCMYVYAELVRICFRGSTHIDPIMLYKTPTTTTTVRSLWWQQRRRRRQRHYILPLIQFM